VVGPTVTLPIIIGGLSCAEVRAPTRSQLAQLVHASSYRYAASPVFTAPPAAEPFITVAHVRHLQDTGVFIPARPVSAVTSRILAHNARDHVRKLLGRTGC
jgi:hypothetical protein